MKIVCASSVLCGREAFETLGETLVRPDDQIGPDEVRDADALIVRSKTHVNEALLGGSSVSFVGTTTAGVDHLDTAWLEAAGKAWSAAPGCNANSVAEYVIAALLHLAQRGGFELAGRTLAVVGVGQVGRRVAAKAETLGMRVVRNDPPLRWATGDPAYRELHEVLREADAVTLHVPLIRGGPFPTHHLAGCDFFEHARPGLLFLNTSRGGVVDEDALALALDRGVVARAALDVWENEPAISPLLLGKTTLATPHIAGYSLEGRVNGTRAVYRAACRFFEKPPTWNPAEDLLCAGERLEVDARGYSDEEILHRLVKSAYDIAADDAALREGPSTEPLSDRFRRLRHEYPVRREFSAYTVRMAHGSREVARKIAGLGFSLHPGRPA